jgi:hypothetical protein
MLIYFRMQVFGIALREKMKEQVVEEQMKMERRRINEKHFVSRGGGDDLTFLQG